MASRNGTFSAVPSATTGPVGRRWVSEVLASADHRRGRFRAFLRTDCGFFFSHHHERQRALKRGGGHTALPIDAREAKDRYLREPTDVKTPERLFDRTWVLNLLDEVLKQLARDYAESGRGLD